MGHIAWGVTSVLLSLVSHRSSAFFRVIHLISFVNQFTAILHAGFLVSYHNFLSLCLCFNKRSDPGMSFISESVTLLVDSLYAEAIEAVKLRVTLSASTPELISTLGEISSEARLWNRSQSVNFSIGSERCLILTWSSMWNTIGRWSEFKISETVTSETWYFGGPQYPARHHYPHGNSEWGIVALKFRID
jgi:hypothetical protein